MIVTITPKGGKPIKKKLATPEEAIQFINSFAGKTRRPTKRVADAWPACGNFKKARDGKCYNCGCEQSAHR